MQRSRHFMNRLNGAPSTVDILRANVALNGNGLDLNIASWTTVSTGVPVDLQPAGSDVVNDGQLGGVAVQKFNAYFLENAGIQENDVLKEGTTYYRVIGVTDYSRYGWQIEAIVVKLNSFRGA